MSKFHRGYKYRIYPNEDQSKQIDRYITLFRNVYNWGIAKEEEIYQQYKQGLSKYGFYNYFDLNRIFTEERNKPENEWLKEIPNTTARLALRNVVNAYNKFFKGITKCPKFKSKKHSKPSFNTRNDRFKIHNNGIKIEGMHDSYIDLGFDSGLYLNKVTNPVISRDNLGNYYVSFNLEEESKDLSIPKTKGVGIDLGIRQTFTLSTGEIYNQPKEKLDKIDRQLKRISRHITRDRKRREAIAKRTKTKCEDIPKSKHELERESKKNKLLRKKHNIKDTFYHTVSKGIVNKNPEFVCMETFSKTAIYKSHKSIAKKAKIHDVSFYDIIQKMKHKCSQYNIPFIQAPVYFASTKTCSNCGSVKNMGGKHVYKCPVCGMIEDRDINAAINLMNYGSFIIVE